MLTYEISPDRARLKLIFNGTDEERAEICELLDAGETLKAEQELFERLLGNSDLEWADASITGDLTDAPMFGIYGRDQRENAGPFGARFLGQDSNGAWYQPLLERWAFMNYQRDCLVRTIVVDGQAILVDGSPPGGSDAFVCVCSAP